MVKLSQINILKAKYRYYKYRSILLENGLLPIKLPTKISIKSDDVIYRNNDDVFSDTTEEDAQSRDSEKQIKKELNKELNTKTVEKPDEQNGYPWQLLNTLRPLEKYNNRNETKSIKKINQHFSFQGELFPFEEMNNKNKPWPEIPFDKALQIVLDYHDYKTKYQKTDPIAKVCETNVELENDIYKQFTFWFSYNASIRNNKDKEDNKYSWTKHIRFGDYISRTTFETIFSAKDKYEQLLIETKNNTNENDSKPVSEYEKKISDMQKQIESPNRYFLNSGNLLPYDHSLFPGIMNLSFEKDSYATFADNFDNTNPFDTVEDWPEISYDDAKDAVLDFLDLHLKMADTLPFLSHSSFELLNDQAIMTQKPITVLNDNDFKGLFVQFIKYYNNINKFNLKYPPNGVHFETFKKILQEKY